jgi:hypothetical protein
VCLFLFSCLFVIFGFYVYFPTTLFKKKYYKELLRLIFFCILATKDKTCLQIDNGSVSISNSFYVVSCDKGFSLDIFEPEEKRSNCIDGKLKSVIGGQEPKCIPGTFYMYYCAGTFYVYYCASSPKQFFFSH